MKRSANISQSREESHATARVLHDLAPSGMLRAAINTGNPALALKGLEGGGPTGPSVDLARELACRLGTPLQLVEYEAAGRVFDAMKRDEWDIAFMAIEPAREEKIAFTSPYLSIEGTYLVRDDAPITVAADIDRVGSRIAVAQEAAYDLFLTRTLRHAQIVRAANQNQAIELFVDQRLDAAAGVRQALDSFASRHAGLRVLTDRFMTIEQAMAVPRSKPSGASYLQSFIESVIASGFVGQAIERHAQSSLELADALTALDPARGNARRELTRRACAEIERRYAEADLSPGTVAESLRVSLRVLHESFAQQNQTFMDTLYRFRLQRAHALLTRRNQERSVAEIARLCGFRSQAHFARRFKQTYGMVPRALKA